MSEAFSATVTISTNESGDTSVSLVASEPVVASVRERVADHGGERETAVDIIPPDVSETEFIETDDGEGDELVIEFANDDADDEDNIDIEDDDLPLAAEEEGHALPH
ncbi:hypothetical protein ACUSIJ_24880 [Pseudochelatococcus sp. B33]